jgi:hypothetical protein
MPGYLIGNSGANSLDGQAKGFVASDISSTETVLFTADGKIRILSCLLVNKTPGILPVTLYIKKSGGAIFYVTKDIRVKERRHAIIARTDSDPRTEGGSEIDDTPSEIILADGESLCATCPVDDSLDAIISVQENIQ